MTKINRENKIHILCCELLPLLDGVVDRDDINGIKFKRCLTHFINKMEDYTADASDAFNSRPEMAKYHAMMVDSFGRFMDNLTYEQLFNDQK